MPDTPQRHPGGRTCGEAVLVPLTLAIAILALLPRSRSAETVVRTLSGVLIRPADVGPGAVRG